MRLRHFSDDPDIMTFVPRPLQTPVDRGPHRGWLNGPLVWATDDAHSLLYLFPRECPRIVIWPTATTNAEDRNRWFGDRSCRAIAYIEDDWVERVRAAVVYRYDMPCATFEDIDDVGMWVSRTIVNPLGVEPVANLPVAMEAQNIELRFLPRLIPLRGVWQTTLHASGIRMRNAQDWGEPGWLHSKPGRVAATWDRDPS
jgi:hypothetical protein